MSSHASTQSRGNASPKKLSTTIYNVSNSLESKADTLISICFIKANPVVQLVMTPVIFVSFLTSLAWVEFHYSLRRAHSHSEEPSALPQWLHRIVYREAPYKYIRASSTKPKAPAADDEGSRWYYHRKQRKLMKMEADDAFQIRRTVLVVLALLGIAASWVLWWVVWWIRITVTT